MLEYQKLQPDFFYHIWNRGNNSECLFIENRNLSYFLCLWKKHTQMVLDTYAYSLNDNNFHLIIQPKDKDWLMKIIKHYKSKMDPDFFVSKQISNCFNAYAKAFNKAYNRTGSLFEERYKRKLIPNDHYFKEAVSYIHLLRKKNHLRTPGITSFETLLSEEQTFLQRDLLMEIFGGKNEFLKYHRKNHEFKVGPHSFLEFT